MKMTLTNICRYPRIFQVDTSSWPEWKHVWLEHGESVVFACSPADHFYVTVIANGRWQTIASWASIHTNGWHRHDWVKFSH
jgi:hypothetical protein